MSSRYEPLPIPDLEPWQYVLATSIAASLSAFGLIMRREALEPQPVLRDRYQRLPPTYNDNYNPYKAPSIKKPSSYSLYLPGEPLFNDWELITARLLKNHVLAPPSARLRKNQVWPLGYIVLDTKTQKKATYWAYKLYKLVLLLLSFQQQLIFLGYYDPKFSKGTNQHFNTNILNNARELIFEYRTLAASASTKELASQRSFDLGRYNHAVLLNLNSSDLE